MAAGLPTAVLVEVEFSAGVWTDVSSLVKGDSIEIKQGRESATADLQPGTLDLDFDNADGRFTPDNPTSTYWPNFVEGKRIRVRVTKSATTYPVFVGRISRIEPDYPTEPTQSVVHVLAVDLLGDLSQIQLGTAFRSYITYGFLSAAEFAYPLDDDTTRTGPVDLTGSCPPLSVFNVKVAGSVSYRSVSGLDGDGTSFVMLKDGKRLQHNAPAFSWDHTSITQRSISGFFYLTAGQYGEILAVTLRDRAGAGTYLSVVHDASGLHVESYVNGTLETTTASVAVSAGWVSVGLTSSSGDIDFDVDGVTIDTFTPTNTTPYKCISIGGTVDVGAANIIFDTATTSLYMSQIVRGGTPTSSLSMLSTVNVVEGMFRLATTLNGNISLSGIGSSDPNRETTALACDGRTALDVLQDLANCSSGIAYHEPSTSTTQDIVIPLTNTTRPLTVALTLDAEADLDGGPTLVRGTDDRLGSATASTPEATAFATGDGTGTREITTILADRAYLQALADDAVAQGANLRTRMTSLPFDLAHAANDLYATFYALRPGNRVRLSGLPTTYFGVSYIDSYVHGWTYRPGVNGHPVELYTSPADAPSEAIWDTSRFAFGDDVCTVTGGTAVGTTSTGTMTLTWATTDTLTTSAGDYPMDFNWNGERVTVTAAPAGGTSPRTLTITARGVAPTVARIHSAGESIEPWDAARWAL